LRSATFGVVIIAIVYLPILSLAGIEGKMFRPMALTILFVLGSSLVLMLTLVPVLASLLLPRRLREAESPIVRVARKGYLPVLELCLRKKWAPLAAALVVLLASGVVAVRLGAEFMPRLGEGALAIQAWRLPSVSLEQSVVQTTDLERVLRSFPDEVETVVSKTGRAEIATDPMGVEVSDVLVMLKPRSQWKKAQSREELVAVFDEALKRNLAGSIFSYSQPIELRVSELISGVRSDVALKIYGDDLRTLTRTADRAVAVLARVPGAADVKAEQISGLPVLRVKIDRSAIARYGINAADVLDVVATLGGRDAGVVVEGRRRFALQARFAPEDRKDVEQLGGLRVRAPGGQSIPLSQLADLHVEDGPAQISHESGRRRITVEMNVRGRDLAGFVADAQGAIARGDIIPLGHFTEWGGQFQNLQAATGRLAIAVPAALLLIFVLLYMSHGSGKVAALVYLNVPFAVTGGIFALAIRGLPFSISAGVGFISLFGVAVLTGLVLVTEMERLRDAGASAAQAAFEGASMKLRAILTVALVAMLGFIPMAIATGEGAEVQRPLATVVIGGLVTSTLLTLIVLPTVYAWLFRAKGAVPKETSS
jgi:cobalt-zinc-cadmium resistance protein CzcA